MKTDIQIPEEEINRLTRGKWFETHQCFKDSIITYYGGEIPVQNLHDTALDLLRSNSVPEKVVLGMSGGIDSALALLLCLRAEKKVVPVFIDINSNREDLVRVINLCGELNLDLVIKRVPEETVCDLANYVMVSDFDFEKETIRRGNIHARLRMMILYDLARCVNGCVISTANLTETALGFWTLHGDVGDVAPLSHIHKSLEIPLIAKMYGLEDFIDITPNDGNGTGTDEDQFGFNYVQADAVLMRYWLENRRDFSNRNMSRASMWNLLLKSHNPQNLTPMVMRYFDVNETQETAYRVSDRFINSVHKRLNPRIVVT